MVGCLTVLFCSYVYISADFCQPKKLTKGQLKQRIAEVYELLLRQTAKIAEINALVQQELHEHIAKLINDDSHSVFKTQSVSELNNYYEQLKLVTEKNEEGISRFMTTLHGLKSNFVQAPTVVVPAVQQQLLQPKLEDLKNKNN